MTKPDNKSLISDRQVRRVLEQLQDDVTVAKQVPAKDANAGRMRPWLMISEVEALLDEHRRLREALREIGTPKSVPEHFDSFDWWRHTASKHGEIARDALGITAEEMIRDGVKKVCAPDK